MPREVVLFLVQLSAVLSKSRAYPPAHPMLTAALDILATQLFTLLKGRKALVLGVARRHLVVDGIETDPDHAVLRDLAERIHRHQVAMIAIRPGVGEDELGDLILALAQETWRQGKPLGLEPADVREDRWPHIAVEPLPLDQLELGDGDAPMPRMQQRADELWQGLVNAAILFSAGEEGEGGTPQPQGVRSAPVSGAEAARAIRARRGDASYSRAIVDWLLQIEEHLGDAGTGSPAHRRVAELFNELDAETLEQLLTLGATIEKRKDLVFRGARALPVKAVLDLLHAAAKSSATNISHGLVKILAKLASHLESGKGPIVPGAEEVLRDSVRQLVGAWRDEDDVSPHRQLLDLLARPVGATGMESGRALPESLRLVQLGLELGVETASISVAVRALADRGDLSVVLDLVDRALEAGLDPSRVEAILGETDFVRERLLDESEDPIRLGRLLDRLGDESAVPLLEALEQSGSASRRRFVLQRLEQFGPRLGPLLVARLPGKPWFVQRNLLNLIGSLPERPAGFSASEYAAHENARVRREAYKLLFSEPAERHKAILAAMTDPDQGITLLGLGAAGEHPPPDLATRLVHLLESSYRAPEVRAAAIRLLGLKPTHTGRAWLLGQVVTRRGWLWFRRDALRAPSPDMLVALSTLARGYAKQPEAARVLRMAETSRDPEIRQAVRVEGHR